MSNVLPRKKATQFWKSAPSYWAEAFLSLCYHLEAGYVVSGGKIAYSTGFPGSCWRNVSSLPCCSSCPLSLSLLTSLLFLLFLPFFFLSLYSNADRPVQGRRWYMWILLSPTCVMELKGCCLCLECEMLSGAIWFIVFDVVLHKEPLILSLAFWVNDTRKEIILKENWSTVTNRVFLLSRQYYSQVATLISFIVLCLYVLVGSSVCNGLSSFLCKWRATVSPGFFNNSSS